MALAKTIEEIIEEDSSGLLSTHPSWVRVKLNDVADVQNGSAFSSANFNPNKGLPLVRIRDVLSGATETYFDGPYEDVYLIENGDFLIGMDGDFNSAFWKGGKALLNQRVCKVTVQEMFFNKTFLAYALPGYLEAINQNTSSVTVKHLSSKTVEGIPLPLPPSNEQVRIVDKLEGLFTDLDNGIAELKAAQVKLVQYRQSLLKSAVDGSLTEKWRAENEGNISETGEQLLQRILKERRERWEQQKLAEFEAKGKKPPKDWQKKYPEPVSPDTSDLPNLPDGWVWASVGQLGHVQLGRQRSPSKLKGVNPVKYIRAANIKESGVDLEDVLKMDFNDREIETFKLHAGDVLLTEASGSPEHVGRPAIWVGDGGLYCFQNTVIRFQPHLISPKYAYHVFYAYQKFGKFVQVAGGVGINHLSAGKFSKVLVPLPPLNEQGALTDILEDELTKLETQIKLLSKSSLEVETQRKNILKSAFSGELVSQDPNDEPASALLERIRSQRMERGKPKRSQRRKVRA